MKNKKLFKLFFLLSIVLSLIITQGAFSQEVSKMAKDELKAMIDNPDLVILDVRSGRDWKSSESKIKNAVREEADKVATWAKKYDKDKIYVLYCA